MTTRDNRPGWLAGLVSAALLAAACGDETGVETDDETPVVVATTSIWADVVSNVLCVDGPAIVTIIPPGADPHGFEPSLADRGRLGSAALVVANGLGLEEGLLDTLERVERSGTPVFELAAHTEPIARQNDAADDGDGPRSDDPHIWFDPIRVARLLPALGRAVSSATGTSQDVVATCVATYEAELAALDAEVTDLIDAVPPDRRHLVTNHDSLAYFADRYGLEILGTVLPSGSSLGEASPAALEELARLIETRGSGVVFTEEELTDADARALADRVEGVEVVTLPTAGLGPDGSGSDTYIGFVRTNARLIAEGMSAATGVQAGSS